MPKIDSLLTRHADVPKSDAPLWSGPGGRGSNGGVTFSLLSRFLTCRERFRLYAIEGLRPADVWNHRLGYGELWHTAEQSLAARQPWEKPLTAFAKELCRRYPTQQEQIDHWHCVCRAQFPIYVRHWQEHPDLREQQPLLQEHVFDISYRLPSDRVIRLRGKWDSVDLVGNKVWLQENKTKADIRPLELQRQLSFDLQTMLYMVALERHQDAPLAGVRYNVVRRPLSGGKGTITRHKGTKNKPEESRAEFYARLAGIIENAPDDFFMRWAVTVTAGDIKRFRDECLDPILEELCRWYDAQRSLRDRGHKPFDSYRVECRHWRHPFGCVNTLDEYGSSDLDSYLESGSMVGLSRTDTLFSELQS
jgi:hypothetical protein